MTLEEQIKQAKNRALSALTNAAEYELREAQTDLMPDVMDFMQSATASNYKETKSGALRALPNKTDKLYVLYGNLVRALTPKKPGNIGEYVSNGATKYMKIGIDLAVVPYAAVHEFGGGNNIPARPYFYPGIKQYVEQGFDMRLKNIISKVAIAWNNE